MFPVKGFLSSKSQVQKCYKSSSSWKRLFVAGHQKQVGPELFRVFYTIWKETEAEAQEVCVFVLLVTHNREAQVLNIQ